MNKKAVVIFGSSRSNGNTMKAVEAMIDEWDVEIIDLSKQEISHYDYQHRNRDDDFIRMTERMTASDIIIFATPVYWYSMSALMKTFIDRLTDLLYVRKDLGRSLKGKICYLIASGTDKKLPIGFEQVFASTANYFDMIYKGHFYCFVQKEDIIQEEIMEAAKNYGNKIFD